MAGYKQPCIQCGAYIDPDVRFCPNCQSGSPFGYHCPDCLRSIQKQQGRCPGCGRPLQVSCPFCGKPTFVQEKCEQCGQSLMVICPNPRCQSHQFFQTTKCTACGKKITTHKEKR